MSKKKSKRSKRSKSLAKSTLDKLRKSLLESRQNLVEDVKNLSRSLSEPPQNEDDTFSYDLTLTLLETQESKIHDIDQSLQRLTNGSYGVCSNCSGSIEFKRLKALPNTKFCLECQKKFEEGLLDF